MTREQILSNFHGTLTAAFFDIPKFISICRNSSLGPSHCDTLLPRGGTCSTGSVEPPTVWACVSSILKTVLWRSLGQSDFLVPHICRWSQLQSVTRVGRNGYSLHGNDHCEISVATFFYIPLLFFCLPSSRQHPYQASVKHLNHFFCLNFRLIFCFQICFPGGIPTMEAPLNSSFCLWIKEWGL